MKTVKTWRKIQESSLFFDDSSIQLLNAAVSGYCGRNVGGQECSTFKPPGRYIACILMNVCLCIARSDTGRLKNSFYEMAGFSHQRANQAQLSHLLWGYQTTWIFHNNYFDERIPHDNISFSQAFVQWGRDCAANGFSCGIC